MEEYLNGYKELLKLPDMIRQEAVKLSEAKRKVDGMTLGLKNMEASVMSEISSEKGEDDKPAFSNEQQRKAELIRRMNDKDVLAARTEFKTESERADLIAIQVQYLRDSMGSLKTVYGGR